MQGLEAPHVADVGQAAQQAVKVLTVQGQQRAGRQRLHIGRPHILRGAASSSRFSGLCMHRQQGIA